MIAGLVFLAATATATPSTARAEVGEPIAITVRVTARANATVTLKPPQPNIPVYTVDAGGLRMVQTDRNGQAELVYHIVAWEHGEFRVAPPVVDIAGQGFVQANALVLRAENPLGPDAADAKPKDIRDIRPFPPEPVTWPYLAGAILAGMLAAWFFVRSRNAPPEKKAAPPSPSARPRRPERTLADWMEAVRRIAEEPPRDPAGIREAHFTIAEAIRRFVEERWEVPASKRTTEEFLREVAGNPRFRGGGMSILPVVLEACDRVKWAHDRVAPQDTLEVARLALEFFAASRGAVSRGLGGERPERPGLDGGGGA